MTFRLVTAIVALVLGGSIPALAEPAFVNGITVPADTLDLSNDPIALNQRVGMFSDLYYDPNRHQWWGLSDRGAGGGTLPYDTRVQQFTIDINPSTGAISNFHVVQTVEFTDPTGTLHFNGLAPNPTNILGRALDPEGFLVNPANGKFLVSDEYGPSVYEFNRDGTLARTFTTPDNLIPRNGTTGVPNFADDTGNTKGRTSNRGFEGLAVSPDGKFVYAMLQSAMLDEGDGNGTYTRIVKFDNATGKAVTQYAYLLDTAGQGRGVSSLVALNDHEFLVLERNNRGVGVSSNMSSPNKVVYQIDLTGASDVSGIVLPLSGPLPAGFTAVTKSATSFFSIDANTIAAFGGRVPEKWEGLTIGPRLSDGQFAILAGTDNDFSVTQNANGIQFDVYYNPSTGARIECDLNTFNNCFSINADGTLGSAFSGSTSGFALIPGVLYAFKSTDGDLAGYVGPVPQPAAWSLLLAGLGIIAFRGRRRS